MLEVILSGWVVFKLESLQYVCSEREDRRTFKMSIVLQGYGTNRHCRMVFLTVLNAARSSCM